jgi:hypothetical protein
MQTMKNILIATLFLFSCFFSYSQKDPYHDTKTAKDFEDYLKRFFSKNYNVYFLNGCDVNKVEVSFKIREKSPIVDFKVNSSKDYLNLFLKDAITAALNDGKLKIDKCFNLKTISFSAFFNFYFNCDKSKTPRRVDIRDQYPTSDFVYKNGLKVIKEDDKNIVLDCIVFFGEIE